MGRLEMVGHPLAVGGALGKEGIGSSHKTSPGAGIRPPGNEVLLSGDYAETLMIFEVESAKVF